MRLVLAVFVALLISACSRAQMSGPAWPKMTEKETDGGESLEPRNPTNAAVAAAKDDRDDDATDAPTTVTEPDTPEQASEATTPETSEAEDSDDDDLIFTTEDIVIEIDDE